MSSIAGSWTAMNELGCLMNSEKLINLTLKEPEIIFPIFSATHSITFYIQIMLIYTEEAAFRHFLSFFRLNRRPVM